ESGNQRIGIALQAVTGVVRMVAITSLPAAPRVVMGVINVHGNVVPVVNPRVRLQLDLRPPDVSDQILLVNTARRQVAVWVASVLGVVEVDAQDFVDGESIFPDLGQVEGVVKTKDGVIVIQDILRFLSVQEEVDLTAALKDA